ncbi:unnamed protein product [Pocillopora meandrina]|uniref:G-protein coupled receptors family 1 profile domain-containing protein n=1 Tax=Pocillopora meandrina TaxID=46732 RepID=A0AAU9WVH3_9CNID|nr:unnamed protein product [Pocillopora meandrina]
MLVLFLANSLVNPIIYALRMPGFREGLLQLVYRNPDISNAPANLPLRNLRRVNYYIHMINSEKMQPFGSASECIPWFVVLIIECLAIVILNIITIVVFVEKRRQLQRRRTYLIIHLAIVDLLAGTVSGPLMIENVITLFCPLWKYRLMTLWSYLFIVFIQLFPFTSLVNLMAISLERLHATFCPFRHRFVRKWVHRAIIIVIWLIPIVRIAAIIFLLKIDYFDVVNAYLFLLFYVVSLFVICVSYILVVIKVRCSRHLQFHSRYKRERKLTGTALIVSLVSLLCFLPAIIYTACCGLSLNYCQNAHISLAVLVLFLANSLVNPIIYALRMPGFREGLLQLFYRVPDLSRIASANLPLRNLRRA